MARDSTMAQVMAKSGVDEAKFFNLDVCTRVLLQKRLTYVLAVSGLREARQLAGISNKFLRMVVVQTPQGNQ